MQYTITAVSKNVRGFDGRHGAMSSYKVKLKDVPNPVEISQKAETAPPKVGDSLEGTIDMSSSYGPQFKKDYTKKPGGGRRDEDAIKAQWAIGAAINFMSAGVVESLKLEEVEPLANDFYAMIDRVKTGNPAKTAENGSDDEFDEPVVEELPEDF